MDSQQGTTRCQLNQKKTVHISPLCQPCGANLMTEADKLWHHASGFEIRNDRTLLSTQ